MFPRLQADLAAISTRNAGGENDVTAQGAGSTAPAPDPIPERYWRGADVEEMLRERWGEMYRTVRREQMHQAPF